MRLFKQILIFVAIMSAAGGALAAEASHELQKDFNVSSGGKLIVNVNGSDIMVRTWDKAQVQMTV
ncbi:MAG: hypothetical protein M1339_01850, partial [Bacteroidetes bacterium]|nr:hypothetical protein [Bacteroidota bacterium]